MCNDSPAPKGDGAPDMDGPCSLDAFSHQAKVGMKILIESAGLSGLAVVVAARGTDVDGKAVDQAQHETCFGCHQANVKDHDFVFTRFAP